MNQRDSSPRVDETSESFFWLRLVYAGTIFLGLTTGPIILFAPKLARKLVGFPEMLPEQDPVIVGVIGCFWTAAGVISIFGLMQPLKFIVIPLIQMIYKSTWLLFVFLPLLIAGKFPDYGWTIAIGNFIFLMLDIKAMPFRYLLSDSMCTTETTEHRVAEEKPSTIVVGNPQ
ncbi:hypothetical protein [Stieleria varia]|nr:hypothetical protein [Stieleria varia]